jgi:hypothetical protein
MWYYVLNSPISKGNSVQEKQVKEETQFEDLQQQVGWHDQPTPFYGGEMDFGNRFRGVPELDIGSPANSNESGNLPKSLAASED